MTDTNTNPTGRRIDTSTRSRRNRRHRSGSQLRCRLDQGVVTTVKRRTPPTVAVVPIQSDEYSASLNFDSAAASSGSRTGSHRCAVVDGAVHAQRCESWDIADQFRGFRALHEPGLATQPTWAPRGGRQHGRPWTTETLSRARGDGCERRRLEPLDLAPRSRSTRSTCRATTPAATATSASPCSATRPRLSS